MQRVEQEPMAETANGERLSVQRALQTICELEGLEPRLLLRTEGMTWMIWGLVGPGIFFTYHAFFAELGSDSGVIFSLLWLPWVALGVIATAALWHGVHADARSGRTAKQGMLEGAAYMGLFLGVMFLGFTIFAFMNDQLELREPGLVTLMLGVTMLLLAFLPYPRSSPYARRMNLVVGLLMVAAAVALGTLIDYGSADRAHFVQTIVGASVGGAGWFFGGLYLFTKG